MNRQTKEVSSEFFTERNDVETRCYRWFCSRRSPQDGIRICRRNDYSHTLYSVGVSNTVCFLYTESRMFEPLNVKQKRIQLVSNFRSKSNLRSSIQIDRRYFLDTLSCYLTRCSPFDSRTGSSSCCKRYG